MKSTYIKNKEQGKLNFDFIDTIRFIAMAAIIFEHTSLFPELLILKNGGLSEGETFISSLYLNIGKFGTIIFFVISGFLINAKSTEWSAKAYLRRRANSIIKPWLIFSSIFFLFITIKDYIKYRIARGDIEYDDFTSFILTKIKETVFYSSYWFVLNLLFCTCFLFLFKKRLQNAATGFLLATLTLFYCVNIYIKIVPTEHTTALFGFVFFLWLGVMLNKNFSFFQRIIYSTSFPWLILLVAITLSFSVAESYFLIRNNSNDPFNTLRISNIAFSIAAFCLFFKMGKSVVIQKLKPRESTYGMYLIHMILLIILIPIVFGPFGTNGGCTYS